MNTATVEMQVCRVCNRDYCICQTYYGMAGQAIPNPYPKGRVGVAITVPPDSWAGQNLPRIAPCVG